MTLNDYYHLHQNFVLAATGLFGMLFGSFLNVVIYRLPRMLQARWQHECTALLSGQEDTGPAPASFNLVFPNSHCPHCQAPIRAWQNVPVLSYLLLRGRCHACHHPIGWRYPAVELLTGLAVAYGVWQFGPGWQALAAALLSCVLIALSVIDLDHQLLPDDLTLPLLWLGLLLNTTGLFCSLPDAVWGAAAGYVSLWSMYWLFRLVTGKEGMGYGDFKLLAALGAWLGVTHIPVIIILSTLAGSVIAGAWLVVQRRASNTTIPFGPFLAIAGWVSCFHGNALIAWYRALGGF